MYSFNTRVRYSELAEDKKASLVSIINYLQDCCTFEAEDGDIGLPWLAEHGTAWMLTGWQIHVVRRPKYCEHIQVTTWACGFKYFVGKRSFTIRKLNEDGTEGEVLVYAMSEWAYVNVAKGLPEKNVPEKEIEVYGLVTPIEERFDEFGATFRSPGHVCLLRGAEGLVKNRQGHTEIGLALCELAGVTPVCVVCEMMDGETGQATSVADARKYAEENGLVLLRGEDIINEYLKE